MKKLLKYNIKSLAIGVIAVFSLLIATNSIAISLEEFLKLISSQEVNSGSTLINIGYYIGSFDPLHLGHEAIVHTILNQNLCNYVLIYPAYGKDEYKQRSDVKLRFDMLFAAFASHQKIIVTKKSPIELQQALTKIDAQAKGPNNMPLVTSMLPNIEYTGIIGSDTAISTQQDPKKLSVFMRGVKIPEKYQEHTIGGIMALPVKDFIVGMRSGDEEGIKKLGNKFGDRPIKAVINTDCPDVSSTMIKARLREYYSNYKLYFSGNHNLETVSKELHLNPKVLEIIKKHQIYQNKI
jgi:nicotinic acid mononucleotide adenylyltransferase